MRMENPDQKSSKRGWWGGTAMELWMEEIFKKLPMKTLCQIRCVCKDWNSMIMSPLFITSFSTTSSAIQKAYFLRFESPSYALYYPEAQQEDEEGIRCLISPFQFTPSNLDSELVDVVNGLVCLSYSMSSSFDSNLVWNPPIRRYVPIPQLPIHDDKALEIRIRSHWDTFNCVRSRFQPNAIGFGYRHSKNDFKVARVWIPSNSSSSSSMIKIRSEVFSSQKGSWRDQETVIQTKGFTGFRFQSCGFITPTGCFLNGRIHWILSTSSNEVAAIQETYSLLLLMFDCDRGEIKLAELPQKIKLINNQGWAEILRYSGMLSVLTKTGLLYGHSFDLWANNNNSNSKGGMIYDDENWNHLFRFSIDGRLDFYRRLVVIGSGEDNGISSQLSLRELASKDPNNKKMMQWQLLNAYDYEESLFLMDDNIWKGVKSYGKEDLIKQRLLNMWRCPQVNWIKLNTHSVFNGYRHRPAGIGGVFTDDQGRFVRAFAAKWRKLRTSLEAQLRCLVEGLMLARHMGVHSLVVETASIQLIQALTTTTCNYEEALQDLVKQCKKLIKGERSGWRVGICHATTTTTQEEINKVADWFAKTGSNLNDSETLALFNDPPYQVEQP